MSYTSNVNKQNEGQKIEGEESTQTWIHVYTYYVLEYLI